MTIDGLSDDDIRSILKSARTFAVVGASAKPDRPSYGVMQFLLKKGYAVKPVNPGLAGQKILDRAVSANLADVEAPADVIDIFRAPDAVLSVVEDAIAAQERLGANVIWMQLGVINEAAAELARRNNFIVVMDRCPKIEIARLLA